MRGKFDILKAGSYIGKDCLVQSRYDTGYVCVHIYDIKDGIIKFKDCYSDKSPIRYEEYTYFDGCDFFVSPFENSDDSAVGKDVNDVKGECNDSCYVTPYHGEWTLENSTPTESKRSGCCHKWIPVILPSYPPQHDEFCSHCGVYRSHVDKSYERRMEHLN